MTFSKDAVLRVVGAAGFAAYGAWSCSQETPLMFGQGVIYLMVAAAFLARAPYAGWFAVGIATGGLVIDVALPLPLGYVPGGVLHLLDTMAQTALLLLACEVRAQGNRKAAAHRLTDGSHERIGWTFALTAASLPAFTMAQLASGPYASLGSCALSLPPVHQQLWLTLTPLVALLALGLMARLRTLGVFVLFGLTLASTAMVIERWTAGAFEHVYAHSYTYASAGDGWFALAPRPEQILASIGQLILMAALVPLAAPIARTLKGSRAPRV